MVDFFAEKMAREITFILDFLRVQQLKRQQLEDRQLRHNQHLEKQAGRHTPFNYVIDENGGVLRCNKPEEVVLDRQGRREKRLIDLNCYIAPFNFVIPAGTGVLITIEENTVFIVGNMAQDVVIVNMGTSLPELFEKVHYTRCPQIVYNRIREEKNQYGDLDWLITHQFLENCCPLMKDDCHNFAADVLCNYDNPVDKFFNVPRTVYKIGPYRKNVH